MSSLSIAAITVSMLTLSNVFMTFAWYGHLKHRYTALWVAILISWSIAFLEYCFQVPANRIGSTRFSFVQLKVMQEVITLVVFVGFMVWYFGERFRWNHAVAFCLIVAAAVLIFKDFEPPAAAAADQSDPPNERVQSVNSR